jgi:hypothetical protein
MLLYFLIFVLLVRSNVLELLKTPNVNYVWEIMEKNTKEYVAALNALNTGIVEVFTNTYCSAYILGEKL